MGGILGTTYVLEGSRLGSRLLLTAVSHSSDERVAAATRYLGHGAGQRLWQGYLQILETLNAALYDEGDAIKGAHQAFALFVRAAERLRTKPALA